jgi:hypothetical protein
VSVEEPEEMLLRIRDEEVVEEMEPDLGALESSSYDTKLYNLSKKLSNLESFLIHNTIMMQNLRLI